MHYDIAVIGSNGEIGKGLCESMSEFNVWGVDIGTELGHTVDYMHVAIPYCENFVEVVNNYVNDLKPKLTVIHSTVPVGTTAKINGLKVHSPVNAKHPEITLGLRTYTKFFGYDDEESGILAGDHLFKFFFARGIIGTKTTELMKLLCLARYGLYLQVADEMESICKCFQLDYKTVVTEWEMEYNRGIDQLDPELKRPIYNPPGGYIGGHCVVENMALLNEQVGSEMLNLFLGKYGRINL